MNYKLLKIDLIVIATLVAMLVILVITVNHGIALLEGLPIIGAQR